MRARLPARCPLFAQDGGACRICRHHFRQRKTGPCHPLEVVRCRTHAGAFTLYPPGHVPYGRQAVEPLAPDGGRLLGERTEGEPNDPLEQQLAGGLFDAALDAAAGRCWPRCSERYGDGGLARYWSGQGRLLGRCMVLTGVAEQQSAELRDHIADVLGVERMLLDEQAQAVLEAPGYRSRGRAVCAVLRAMRPSRLRYQRLSEAGRLAGLLGPALYWDQGRGVLVRVPFRLTGTRDPPPAHRRAGRPTRMGR